jgi:uncharacterized membrane protein YfcA
VIPALVSALAVLAAAFVKGTIGIGFPTVATPVMSLVVDVKVAVVALILPNMVMDAVQLGRLGAPWAEARRFGVLLAAGGVGTVIGTRLLIVLPSRTVTLILGGFVLLFVLLNATRLAPRVPPRWEPLLSPMVGALAGVVGGLTNVPGTPLAIYFYALGMDKQEFVRAVAFTFLVYKAVQLATVAWYGFLTPSLLAVSGALTVLALGGVAAGHTVQNRLAPEAVNRAVLLFLAGLGAWLVVRALAL